MDYNESPSWMTQHITESCHDDSVIRFYLTLETLYIADHCAFQINGFIDIMRPVVFQCRDGRVKNSTRRSEGQVIIIP